MLTDEMKEWIENHSNAKVSNITLGERPSIRTDGKIPAKVLEAFSIIFCFKGKGHFVREEGAFHGHYYFIYSKGGLSNGR